MWEALIADLNAGKRVEIDEEIYYYFLEVLPPVFMARIVTVGGERRPVTFGFAEGAERVKAFWREKRTDGTTRYFAQQTDLMNPHA